MNKQQSFVGYIHNFRGIAIIFIVAGHVIISIGTVNSEILSRLNRLIFLNGAAYFIFIAGFLFQLLSDKYKYSEYLKKKIHYILLPYIFMSIPVIFLRTTGIASVDTWFADNFLNLPIYQQVILYLFTGSHMRPFWFIPVIVIFYLFAPIFKWIAKDPKMYLMIPLLFVISGIITRPIPYYSNPIQAFIHFLPIYLSGMFICFYRNKLFKYKNIWVLGIIIITVIIIIIDAMKIMPNFIFYNGAIRDVLLSIVFIYLLNYVGDKAKLFTHKISVYLSMIADLSFGIFFLHDYFIFAYNRFLEKSIDKYLVLPDICQILIVFMVVMLLCISSLLWLKKILGKKSRFVIGC